MWIISDSAIAVYHSIAMRGLGDGGYCRATQSDVAVIVHHRHHNHSVFVCCRRVVIGNKKRSWQRRQDALYSGRFQLAKCGLIIQNEKEKNRRKEQYEIVYLQQSQLSSDVYLNVRKNYQKIIPDIF